MKWERQRPWLWVSECGRYQVVKTARGSCQPQRKGGSMPADLSRWEPKETVAEAQDVCERDAEGRE